MVRRRIALFIPTLEYGGAERVMIMLANGLAARGHHVTLLVARGPGAYGDAVSPNVVLRNLGSRRLSYAFVALRRYVRAEQPDVLISALNHANVLSLLLRLVHSGTPPLIITVHNSLSSWQNLRLRDRFVLKSMRALSRRASSIVAVSEGIRRELLDSGFPASTLKTIYNPLDLDTIQKHKDASTGYGFIDQDSDVPLVVAAGRFSEQKDFLTLIRAIRIVNSRMTTNLAILGDGVIRNQLEEEIHSGSLEDRILLPGFQENPFAWFSRADLFVLSSRWEGLPGVLLEAMACGTPVVSTDCPTGPAEILEGGKWGELVPIGDPTALADAIQSALTTPVARNVLDRAREFSAEGAVLRYERIIEDLLQAR